MRRAVTVIGGGLAGSELALQLAARGFDVSLVEMRPETQTPAHQTPYLAELVCSNSLKSDHPETASGLLKGELRMLGCRLLEVAGDARVPAGHALAVDRTEFASRVTELVRRNAAISVERREQADLELPIPSVIATGPLTSQGLAASIQEHFSRDHLYFYDAISISVDAGSIDQDRLYRASRYGKGTADYWNVPFDREEYERLVAFLIEAPKTKKRGFENGRCFEACLPVEVAAARGMDALRFGPMRPKGLPDPRTGREPYAVLQLRQETRDGSMLGLVGFQTRLTWTGQRELLGLIPGLEGAEIIRWGAIHRNTFIDSPRLLDEGQMSRERSGLYFAGQIVGVEGYMESIAHGILAAHQITRAVEGRGPLVFPPETLLGALQRHLAGGGEPFQPMNVNFGLLPAIEANRRVRKRLLSERSFETLRTFVLENEVEIPHPA